MIYGGWVIRAISRVSQYGLRDRRSLSINSAFHSRENRENIKATVEKAITIPTPTWALILVLLGDWTFDERLLEVPQELLGADLVDKALIGIYGGLIDPIFGPTMSLAHRSGLYRMGP